MAAKANDQAATGNKAGGASFRVRATGRFRPNITEMKSNARQNYVDTPSRAKHDAALSLN